MFNESASAVAVAAPFLREDLVDGLSQGLLYLAACAVLEALSITHVRALFKHKQGPALYGQGFMYLLFNMLVLTPLVFATNGRYLSPVPHALSTRAFHVLSAFAIHSVGYYAAHRAMHTPALYWCHRFHHRFNQHITPLAANAVTPAEYLLAYAVPFTVWEKLFDACGLSPDRACVRFVVCATGLINLLLHTPWLEDLAERYVPSWFVSTHDHFSHHRKLAMNYAAPTFNIDVLVRGSARLDAALARLFGKAYTQPAGEGAEAKRC